VLLSGLHSVLAACMVGACHQLWLCGGCGSCVPLQDVYYEKEQDSLRSRSSVSRESSMEEGEVRQHIVCAGGWQPT